MAIEKDCGQIKSAQHSFVPFVDTAYDCGSDTECGHGQCIAGYCSCDTRYYGQWCEYEDTSMNYTTGAGTVNQLFDHDLISRISRFWQIRKIKIIFLGLLSTFRDK